MSKAAKTIGKIAGVVAGIALIGSGIGAALGGTMVLAGVGTASSIAAIAGAVSGVAGLVAQATAPRPRAVGSTSQVQIGANLPIPYVMGRTYIGGNLVHDTTYGGADNPYRSMAMVWSGAGPIDSIEAIQSDYTTVTFSSGNATGYYNNFMYSATQLGATPEASALAGPFGAIPQWGSAYKLSGYAAGLFTLKFDKKNGKMFASGLPQLGAILKGVKVYDPRLDSTYPGGSGAHRFDDESTWEWSDNPALHGIAYARGRYHNSKKVMGAGFAEDSIDLPAWVDFANTCDTNGWVVGGTIYEPGSKWNNLKLICEAGGGMPVFVGAKLSVMFSAPRIALDTITADDLADGEYSVPAMKPWRERKNGIIPRYRSEDHKWEYVQSDLVTVSGYVTEDGEEKQEERQFDLVQDKDQAAQLAAYALVNGREFGPIILPCKPRLIEYVIGEALEVDIPELGLSSQLCVITGRRVDPATAVVYLTLESETTAKHAYALGETGTAPPTPSISTGEELDEAAAANRNQQISIEVPPLKAYAADYQGTVVSGLLPETISPKVAVGSTSIKLEDTTTYAITNSGVTATIDNTNGSGTKGDISVTALTANSGYIDLVVTVDGTAYPAVRIAFRKDVGLAPAFGGSGAKIASDNSFTAISSTSYTAISDTVTVTLAASELLYGTAPLDYLPANTGGGQVVRTATLKWQYSVAGAGVWNDFGTGIAGTSSQSGDAGEPIMGHVDANQTKSGLAAGDYDVRLMALLSASGRSVSFTGSAVVEAKP